MATTHFSYSEFTNKYLYCSTKEPKKGGEMKVPDLCIHVGSSSVLSHDVQRLLFKHGCKWRDSGTTLQDGCLAYIDVRKGIMLNQKHQTFTQCTLKGLKQILKEDTNMFDSLKSYVRDNQTTIFTIIALALIDQYFLGGRLKERIQSLLDKVLGTCEAKLLKEK